MPAHCQAVGMMPCSCYKSREGRTSVAALHYQLPDFFSSSHAEDQFAGYGRWLCHSTAQALTCSDAVLLQQLVKLAVSGSWLWLLAGEVMNKVARYQLSQWG